MPANFPHFVRLDRDESASARHYVVHVHDPRFTLELTPDGEASDTVGCGVIKRLCVPNSWAGDYGKCTKLLGQAQKFFAQSGGGPPPRR